MIYQYQKAKLKLQPTLDTTEDDELGKKIDQITDQLINNARDEFVRDMFGQETMLKKDAFIINL